MGNVCCFLFFLGGGCVADLDAHGFCRGYTNPLAMKGGVLIYCLSGRNTMLGNEVYVINILYIRP